MTLSFEERQRQWTGALRTFQQHHGRNERPSVWEIHVDGDRVFTRHGLLDGAMQNTDYQGQTKNVGRSNAITAVQDALAEARRDVRKKWDFEGYDEYENGVNLDRRAEGGVDVQALLANLPGSFCLYKPENNLFDQKGLLKKAEAGKVLYTIKRDGLAHWVVEDYYSNIQIYSRRSRPWNPLEGPQELADGTMDYSKVKPWALRFPHIVESVKRLGLPPGSMLAGDLIWFPPGNSRESLPGVSSYTKSLTDQSQSDQAKNGLPFFYWWDLPFLGGHDLVSTERPIDRFARIHDYAKRDPGPSALIPLSWLQFPNPQTALEYAEKYNLEGFVVVDPDGIYGDRAWNLKGKPDRPGTCCAKLKPKQEDDFIVEFDPIHKIGKWGTGKHEPNKLVTLPSGEQIAHGGVGALGLFQIDAGGKKTYIGKCSSGMEYEFQAKLRHGDFPFVAEIQYTERTYISDGDDTNALRHPVFVRRRDDKKPEECINLRLGGGE